MSLSTIREFVNKNFDRAECDSLVLERGIRNFHKKERYLNQIIWFKPGKPPPPKEKVKLTSAEQKELKKYIDWYEEAAVEDFAKKTDYEEIKERFTNMAEAGNLDCIRKAREWAEDNWIPIGESGSIDIKSDDKNWSRPTLFWDAYRDCVERKQKSKKKGGRG